MKRLLNNREEETIDATNARTGQDRASSEGSGGLGWPRRNALQAIFACNTRGCLLDGFPASSQAPIALATSSRSYRWMQAASTSPIPSSPADAAVSSQNNDGRRVSGTKTFLITAAILCLLWVFGSAFAILLDGA